MTHLGRALGTLRRDPSKNNTPSAPGINFFLAYSSVEAIIVIP